jgi:hypothetical protein
MLRRDNKHVKKTVKIKVKCPAAVTTAWRELTAAYIHSTTHPTSQNK